MELTAQTRDHIGKKVRMAREAGNIPAELYGHGVANAHLSLPRKEFMKIWKQAGENTMITLVLGEKNDRRPVMIHDVSFDSLTDEVLNVDLYQVRLDEKIRVKVPLELMGVSPAVKDKGGVLVRTMHDIEVEALPADLPSKISVDISKIMEIGEGVYVKDIMLEKSVRSTVDPLTVIASVVAKVTEEEEAKLAAEVKIEDIKVETEEKKAEREAVKEAAATPEPEAK